MKILLVTEVDRKDFINPFLPYLEEGAKFVLLGPDAPKQTYYGTILGSIKYWYQYNSAQDLLNKIQPDKIVFHHIESIQQVSLCMAAKAMGIPTFHLEHGIRNYNHILNKKVHVRRRRRKPTFFEKLNPGRIIRQIKTRGFVTNTIKKLEGKSSKVLKDFVDLRLRHNWIDTCKQSTTLLRSPDRYLAFSPKTLEFHQITNHLPVDYPVTYLGIPSTDQFYQKDISQSGNNILFIDQPLYEDKTMGWTKEKKEELFINLKELAKKTGKKIFVKPHPRSDFSFWTEEILGSEIEVLNQAEEFNKAVKDSEIVIGFYSTLLMPMMAYEHLTAYSINFHPLDANDIVDGDFFSESGAIEPTYSWKELADKIEAVSTYQEKQQKNKPHFVKDWMYAFDGKANQRLKEALTQK